jgi:hypothetical protein
MLAIIGRTAGQRPPTTDPVDTLPVGRRILITFGNPDKAVSHRLPFVG